jgi:putative ABC transport system substrate-binding protein
MRMRRREFIALLGGAAAAWPPAARALQAKVLRIGMTARTARSDPHWAALEQRLRELEYVDGQSLAIEFIMIGAGENPAMAMKELVRRNVDIILAVGPEDVLLAAVGTSSTLPIVMIAIDYDPFARGYVTSLARPTGNITGVYFQQIELAQKRVQILKEAFPALETATVFWDFISAEQWQATQRAGATLGVRMAGVGLREPHDYERAFAQAALDERGALMVMASGLFFAGRGRIAELARKHRVRTIFPMREFADAGGLISYGASMTGLFRRAAEYVDRIAKGAKPADLPIEQPTKFELVVNLRTAKEIGVELPTALLVRADEVIE